jgi:hypothetical protein
MKIIISGEEYGPVTNDGFSADIEYGIFKLRITKPKYLDFVRTFTIDEGNKAITIVYKKTDAASTFVLQNHGFRNWKIVLKNENGKVNTAYNENEMSVSSG